MYRISPHIRRSALALLIGGLIATLWVNLAPGSYYDAIEWQALDIVPPDWIWAGSVTITPVMVVTDMLMALVFFLIGKELWEALVIERGAFARMGARLPAVLVVGGMIGAGASWLILQALLETAEEASPGIGWPLALGTDTMLVYLFARAAFGKGHPALHLVLMLAIGTDIGALLVLGLASPHLSLHLLWLALPLIASWGVWQLHGRPRAGRSERARRASQALWPYVVAGALCWFGTAASGLPAALGLLPLIPAIAHSDRSYGIFAEAEVFLHDPLNQICHHLERPIIAVMFLFGLTRGGVDLAAFQSTTLVVLGALWLGRPLGLALGCLVATRAFGLSIPARLTRTELGFAFALLGLGFSVPAIAVQAALPGGAMQEAARMGLALSLTIGPLAMIGARAIGLHRSAPTWRANSPS